MYVMVRLSVLRARSWQLPQVLRRSTARATSAPGKVPAIISKGVAYHAECVLRILDGRRAHRLGNPRPEEVGVVVLVALDDTSVGQDHLRSDEVVERQPVHSSEDAEAAAEGEAGDADRWTGAGRESEIV